jgi:chemotaxis protein methyltransferase CheR
VTVTPALPQPREAPCALPRVLGDREFDRLQRLIHREAGIWLAPVKRALLVGRLSRRVSDLGLGSFGAYCDRVEEDGLERIQMLDRITTNETHFFREPRHFEILAREIFPQWAAEAEEGRRPRRARVWSAASSTGEEPYSLAMTLLRAFPPGSGWQLDVLGTDLSTRALDASREAIWPVERSREIPAADLKAFMLRGKGPQEGLMKAGPEIRALVRFARLNLNDAAYADVGEFDLVFCRNVLIYFDAPTKDRVVTRLLDHLAPGGLLIVGHSESLSSTALPVRTVLPTVYAHRGGAAAREARAP